MREKVATPVLTREGIRVPEKSHTEGTVPDGIVVKEKCHFEDTNLGKRAVSEGACHNKGTRRWGRVSNVCVSVCLLLREHEVGYCWYGRDGRKGGADVGASEGQGFPLKQRNYSEVFRPRRGTMDSGIWHPAPL